MIVWPNTSQSTTDTDDVEMTTGLVRLSLYGRQDTEVLYTSLKRVIDYSYNYSSLMVFNWITLLLKMKVIESFFQKIVPLLFPITPRRQCRCRFVDKQLKQSCVDGTTMLFTIFFLTVWKGVFRAVYLWIRITWLFASSSHGGTTVWQSRSLCYGVIDFNIKIATNVSLRWNNIAKV